MPHLGDLICGKNICIKRTFRGIYTIGLCGCFYCILQGFGDMPHKNRRNGIAYLFV